MEYFAIEKPYVRDRVNSVKEANYGNQNRLTESSESYDFDDISKSKDDLKKGITSNFEQIKHEQSSKGLSWSLALKF